MRFASYCHSFTLMRQLENYDQCHFESLLCPLALFLCTIYLLTNLTAHHFDLAHQAVYSVLQSKILHLFFRAQITQRLNSLSKANCLMFLYFVRSNLKFSGEHKFHRHRQIAFINFLHLRGRQNVQT